ncbi:MAG: tetratricopeptide repeat protein [Gemmatimonadota bacterium]|nr:tetratricopeptide repeat protein [Gemmatimonadota bacterium]
MVNTPRDPHGDVEGLIAEGQAAERAARYRVARQRYEAALRALGGPLEAPRASALLRWIARTHEAEGDHAAAFDCLDAALAIATASGSGSDIAHALNCRGILLFRRGELDAAERLYREARDLAEACGEETLVAMADQNLGNVANIHGDHEGAHEQYLKSLHRYRSLGLEEYVGPLLTNIGRVHTDLQSWGEAEALFRLAEASCDKSGNVAYKILVKVNQTRLHLSRGDFAEARVTCDEAHELSLDLDDDRWLGDVHKHRGIIMGHLRRPALAESCFESALELATRREEPLLEAEVRNEMARLYQHQERHREMLECLNQAHRAFARLRARRDLADVDRQIERLERSFEGLVREWGDSIESTDHYTQGHCERVADHAHRLAVAAGLDSGTLTWFRMGALLHDVGKVAVPPEILNKPGPLSDREWVVMKEHPRRGVELLADVEFPWDIRPMVLHHHERWDGTGYPQGLSGEEIPLAARILCVADVFDALTTARSYRRSFSVRAALEIMEGDAGHVFDPDLFALFRDLVSRSVRPAEVFVASGRTLMNLAVGSTRRRPPVHVVA